MHKWFFLAVGVGVGCSSANPPPSDGGSTDCTIEGVAYQTGQVQAGDPCQVCAPETSTTTWTPEPDLFACDAGAGTYCKAGVCVDACAIGGLVVSANSVNPANACQICSPAMALNVTNIREPIA